MATTTNTIKRVTKAQRFEDIKALLTGNKVIYGTSIEDACKFCDSELALLAKKNSSEKKPTKIQEENIKYKDMIFDFLSVQTGRVTCTDIQKGIPEFDGFNNQKIAQLVSQMVKAGIVSKETEKGRSMFSLA